MPSAPKVRLFPCPRRPQNTSIAQLSQYSKVFETFYKTGDHARLTVFLQRLEAVDTATVFPLLLHVYAELMPDQQDELDRILELLEAYLMRRLICNLTPKNYNRFFVDMIRALGGCEVSAVAVEGQLAKGGGDSTRFPTDDELRTAVFEQPLYGRLAVYKVRAVLEALDVYAHSVKSEFQPLPPKLTIEHVMPQQWAQFWPLPSELRTDPLVEQKATARRNSILNTLGNLTLITGSLNPSLSNSAWAVKRPELLKFSKLNLTRYFHGPEANDWNEDAIVKRTEHLFGDILAIWPDIERALESVPAD